jgi:hypothetical protein
MSNTAKIAVPGASDGGKAPVYNSGTDAWDLTDLATQAELNTHESDTTSVHGITDTSTLLNATLTDAKGDLLVATAADTVTRLAVGTNTHVLTADSAEATGLKWAAAAGGSSDPLNAEFVITGRMFGR